jgi:UDP-N-acetylmuramate--alanine ligase
VKVPVPDELLPAERLGRVHFIGIGGAALSAIARIMAARGVLVTGSDDNDTPFLPALRELGVTVHLGYAAAHLGDLGEGDTVVITTAAREDNPEVLEARARGLRMLPRSAGLAAVMDSRDVLAVAGTHGKTTTTALLTVALLAAGADPTYAVGGVLRATGRNADAGAGRYFVAEADESDGAFLVYSPHAAIVTNVEADHLDQWGSEEAYRAAFLAFLDRIEPGGLLVLCGDDDGARALTAPARERGLEVVLVGTHDVALDYRATDLSFEGTHSRFTVRHGDDRLGEVDLQIPGRHYVVDALAALVLGLRLGFAFDDLRRGVEEFTGSGRRMEPKGEEGGVRVVDSYAHMPQEIAADLAAARGVAGEGRLVVAFQPHLVSRTRHYGAGMGRALGAADEVVVTDVYLAREDADPEVTGRLVADAVPLPSERVAFVPDLDDVPAAVVARARPGDLVLTLGAGSVTELGPRVLELLRDRDG